MKKNIIISESQFERIFKRFLNESPAGFANVENRNVQINSDGTLTIPTSQGSKKTIRMTTKLGDINVKNIQKTQTGYIITGKKGNSKEIEREKIQQVLKFVDTGSPKVIDSGSMVTPNLMLKQV